MTPKTREFDKKVRPEFTLNRRLAKMSYVGESSKDFHPCDDVDSENYTDCEIITSRIENSDEHLPVLDFDFPCMLIESSTSGRHHLYINKPVSWEDYTLLLDALLKCGFIESGYHAASMEREYTAVRKPGFTKNIDFEEEM